MSPINREFQRLANSMDTVEWSASDWFRAGYQYNNKGTGLVQEKRVRRKGVLKLRVIGKPGR